MIKSFRIQNMEAIKSRTFGKLVLPPLMLPSPVSKTRVLGDTKVFSKSSWIAACNKSSTLAESMIE